MGRDKGLVQFKGIPLVAIVRDLLRSVTDEVIVSVRRGMVSQYRSVLGPSTLIVEDLHDGLGPMEGLSRALPLCKGAYAVVAPCDTPFLKPGVCRLVADTAQGHDGAVPRVRGYLEPLHGAYRTDAAEAVFGESIRRGVLKPQEILDRLDIALVEEDEILKVDPKLDSFRNLNTPEDLRKAEETVGRGIHTS